LNSPWGRRRDELQRCFRASENQVVFRSPANPLSVSPRVHRAARPTGNDGTTRAFRASWLDLILILLISVIAQITLFSGKQGRAILCGDSAQYVAEAEASLDPSQTAHFEMRKPGYVFYLAAVRCLAGNMGWAAVAGNHLFLSLLPVCAYLLGRLLHGRFLGWSAAIVTLARLDAVAWGNRMMTESMFTCLFSFALVTFLIALSHRRTIAWMLAAGSLFGLAWLTRGSAAPIIAVALLTLLWIHRSDWRRCALAVVCLATPVASAVVLECALNHVHSGRFRPSNGTAGATILLRARHFEGADWPDLSEVDRVLSFLPERSSEDAYRADYLDVWVARHRAITEHGMNEWDYDDLMGRVGKATLQSIWPQYLWSSLRMSMAHLFRDANGQRFSPVEHMRKNFLQPAHVDADADWNSSWFAFYATPHLSSEESMAIHQRMKVAASTRAPFGDEPVWKALRYWKTKPVVRHTLVAMQLLGSIWPVAALILGWWLGLKRYACAFLLTACVADALFIGFLTPTNDRLQFIWFVTDTTASVGGVAFLLTVILHALRRGEMKTPFSSANLRQGTS